MSYDIDLYFGEGELPEKEYRRFLEMCPRLAPSLSFRRYSHVGDRASPTEEWFVFEDNQDIESEDWSSDHQVNVFVELHNNSPDNGPDVRVRHKAWSVSVETGAGRTEIGLMIQLLIPIVGFACFRGCILEDVQCGLPEELNEKYYTKVETYLSHTKRLLDNWSRSSAYPTAAQQGLVDSKNRLIVPSWLKEELSKDS